MLLCGLHRLFSKRQAFGARWCFASSRVLMLLHPNFYFILLEKEKERPSNLSPLTQSSLRLSIVAIVE